MPSHRPKPDPDDPAFREVVIQRLLREQRSIDELAGELGIDPLQVEAWKKDYIDRLRTATKRRGGVRKTSAPVPDTPVVDDLSRKRVRPEDGRRRTAPIVAFPVAGAKPMSEEERRKLEETRRLILEEGKISGEAGRNMGMLPTHAYDDEAEPSFTTDSRPEPPVTKHAIPDDSQERFAANWNNLGPAPEPRNPLPAATGFRASERFAQRLYQIPVLGWIMRGCSFQSAPWVLALLLTIVAGTTWYLLSEHREALEMEPEVRADATPISYRPVSREERQAAEAQIKAFFEARSVSEMEPLIRHPEIIRPLALRHYGGASVEPQPVFEFGEAYRQAYANRPYTLHEVKFTPLSSPSEILVEHTEDGPKIDWEVAVHYQPMTWATFQRSLTRDTVYFRVVIQHSSLYLEPFADPARYRSFRIIPPRDARIFNGFVPAGSDLEAKLTVLLPEKDSTSRVILGIRYPSRSTEDETSPADKDLVEIAELLNESWVVDYTDHERHYDLAPSASSDPAIASSPAVELPSTPDQANPTEEAEGEVDALPEPSAPVAPEEPQG